MKVLRLAEVKAKTKLSRTSIYRLGEQGKFPKSIKIGLRVNGWLENEVDEWLEKYRPNLNLIKLKELSEITSLKRSAIDNLEHRGYFPKRIKLPGKGMVGWIREEIEAWIKKRRK